MSNFIEFGIKKSKVKKVYEKLSGNLYDTYMLSRYFKDIYNLQKIINKKISFKDKLLHDNKDLKFNLINFILVQKSKKNKFYEFGFTLYEKIFYFKFFNKFFVKKLNIDKIKFFGTDISDQFIFFCQNFYKELNIQVSKKVRKNLFKDAIFFSKGVTLLYEKKNMIYLKKIIKNCESGSFDISLFLQKKIRLLETGYKLHYPSIKEFKSLINRSDKFFYYRNKKKIGEKLYLEVIFGKKDIDKEINDNLLEISKNKKIKNFRKHLSLNKKFYKLELASIK